MPSKTYLNHRGVKMGKTVLIIDDDINDRMLIKRSVQSRNDNDIEFIELKTAKEALETINNRNDIDYIFLDYMLPDMDGISVLKSTYDKQRDLGPAPIIMMTGQGSEAIAIDAIRYGAQDYIMKNNMSRDTLNIAIAKAKEVFELKKANHETKQILLHSQKMDAIGNLTGGVAHDFNNLLTVILGNIHDVNMQCEKEEINREELLNRIKNIENTTERGANLVRKLMLFARQKSLEPVPLNPNQMIEEIESLLRRTLERSIDITLNLDENIKTISVDASQLEHTLINISLNARDAMPDGGKLDISTQNIQLSKEEAIELDLPPGEYIKIDIADTGTGINENVMEDIFDPFVTTKEIGKGTGLGLSVVYGFIKESKGAIKFKSKKDHGTVFSLYFPTKEIDKNKNMHNDIEVDFIDQNFKGTDTILLVEDEEEIKFVASTMLKEMGYKVIEASTGDEALEIFQKYKDEIDILFTDITMPGELNGVQLAARIESIKPEIELLFTTGYIDASVPDIKHIENYPMLYKPYRINHLKLKLKEIMDKKVSKH